MSHTTRSRNAAELLSRFREQQALCNEHRIEVGTIFGACFVYHPTGCDRCSSYLEHLLEDIEQRPAKFSFSKDEIMTSLHEAWPHISEYSTALNAERITLEKELKEEKANNHRLQSDMDDLDKKIQELEVQLLSLQPKTPTDVGPHPLSRKLFEDPSFQNQVPVPEQRPDYWSLYMWNILKDWHTNPMSVPNVLRDNHDSYFLEEDIDIAAWISKVAVDISRSAFMAQMKAVFGSRDNFDTAFSGFNKNLLRVDHEATMWITSLSTPLKQIYGRIIPYMIQHEAKCPCSKAGSEHAAYMHLNQHPPAPNKDKQPVTGSLQSLLSVHVPTPAKTGESSRQRLDADLESYNQVCDLVLPYDEAPPSGEPETGNTAPPSAGASSTLHEESTMDIDQELDDIYS
ncbi:hypothetical protein M422DRAFT_256786 [Sphaerobolus stellatus SS14]|uniref:Uncharacterized protein n=1 Tax=Sphaerobolus stellatus (strain SS14) TaxID=990650 RepID=A0A0C9VPX7_SPHS4|nr:hypothetical protein M422DRAFT_256786 [Sphaerobolus stellatus SS14]